MTDVIKELKETVGTPDPPPKRTYSRGRVECYETRLSYSFPEDTVSSPLELINLVASDMASLLQFAVWDESVAVDLLSRLRQTRDFYLATFQVPAPGESVASEE